MYLSVPADTDSAVIREIRPMPRQILRNAFFFVLIVPGLAFAQINQRLSLLMDGNFVVPASLEIRGSLEKRVMRLARNFGFRYIRGIA